MAVAEVGLRALLALLGNVESSLLEVRDPMKLSNRVELVTGKWFCITSRFLIKGNADFTLTQRKFHTIFCLVRVPIGLLRRQIEAIEVST